MPAPAPDLHLLAPREWTFTVEDYHRLGEAGILDEDSRVELIDGRLIAMSPIGSAHLVTVTRLTYLLAQRLYAHEPPPALVSVQNPLRLNDGTEPQPDLVLLRPDMGVRVPLPEDALLVIEVADATLDYDRAVKRPRYAAAGVPELWIVDLGGRAVEVYRQPGPGGYAEAERLGEDGALAVAALPEGPPIPVREVLPPAEP